MVGKNPFEYTKNKVQKYIRIDVVYKINGADLAIDKK
jgi:hypothetical protein